VARRRLRALDARGPAGEHRRAAAVARDVRAPDARGPRRPAAEIGEALAGGALTLIDARVPERYRGDLEPLDPVAGHIPGARNRPYVENVNPDADLQACRHAAPRVRPRCSAVHAARPGSCITGGSGVTGCHNVLAMEIAGLPGTRLYPGSWSEWCADPGPPRRDGRRDPHALIRRTPCPFPGHERTTSASHPCARPRDASPRSACGRRPRPSTRPRRFRSDLYRECAALGLFGITVADAHGGLGADVRTYAAVMEELSRGYASVADQCGLIELVGTLLSTYGTPAQIERYVPPLVAFEKRCAYALTEAEAGSDLASLKTTALPDGDGWRLTGQKLWIHNAPVADFRAGARAHRPAGPPPRHEHLHCRPRRSRLLARQEGAQDGAARLAGRRAVLRRRAPARRCRCWARRDVASTR